MVLSMPQFVISLCIGLFVLMLIIFPSFRAQLKVLLGGFLQVFVQDKAKTPEGAKAIYTSAIEEKQNKYNDICNIVNNLAGKLESLKAEFNTKPHKRGTVSMARSMMPDSADSQFFICFAECPWLNGQYTVWGEVTSGMEFVDMIKRGSGANGMVSDPDEIISMQVIADIDA